MARTPTNQNPSNQKQSVNSTAEKQPPPPTTEEIIASMVEEMKKLMAPSLEFQTAGEQACEEDIRFLWDVKIIKGKDTLFGRVYGTSTMPGLLEESETHIMVERVSAEMIAKIADPVTAKFLRLANRRALEVVEDDTLEDLPVRASLPLTDDDMALEAEIISDQGS